jgi:hypothetical protein
VTTDYTDIVARFTDELAAETLAKFIADAGISCDVVDRGDIVAPMPESYGVRVPRDRIDELKDILKLTPVAKRLTPVAAELMAGRLARENVPSYIGGWHLFGGGGIWGGTSDLQLDATRTLKETKEPGYMIAVPALLFKKAMRILNQAPISEAELTNLALDTAPDPKYPT